MMSENISLIAYAGRRALAAIPLLAGVLLVTFVLIHRAPGDPVSILGGVILGVLASCRPGSALDVVISACCVVFHSIPVFWLGQLLLLFMALSLDLFPVQGMISAGQELNGFLYLVALLHHLALPTIALALHHLALIARVTRSASIACRRGA